jgi:hypothetical protein
VLLHEATVQVEEHAHVERRAARLMMNSFGQFDYALLEALTLLMRLFARRRGKIEAGDLDSEPLAVRSGQNEVGRLGSLGVPEWNFGECLPQRIEVEPLARFIWHLGGLLLGDLQARRT